MIQNNRIKNIAELNQQVIDFEDMSKKDIIEHYKSIAMNNMKLRNENRRYIVSKKVVSKKEGMKTRHNQKKRQKRSTLLIYLESLISEAMYTRKQIINNALFMFDTQYAISTINTYLTDSQNDKYFKNVFDQKVVKTNEVLHFIDTKVKTKIDINYEKNQMLINSSICN